MAALVTGSSGHLGEALVRTLRSAGTGVRGVDILPSGTTDRVGSIADAVCVDECMEGVEVIYHAATLHKPHVATHGRQDFIDTNVSGTLTLLEAAVRHGVRAFIFTSTTSVFGDAMVPGVGGEAVWVTEDLRPVPKNIYGMTKAAAEDLCHLFHRKHGLACLVLRTSRFFPEEDDNPELRGGCADANIKANEMLFRRADTQDIVTAHLLAAKRAPGLGFGRYIISATSPFQRGDLAQLAGDAPGVVARYFPNYASVYAPLGWRMFDHIGRVYVNDAARRDLGWEPEFDFSRVLASLEAGEDFRSPLARLIGSKGYHDEVFSDRPYPVEAD